MSCLSKWFKDSDRLTSFLNESVCLNHSLKRFVHWLTFYWLNHANCWESLKTPLLMCRQFFVMFLLLLSITYTHVWYLCGTPRCLKILWYYHGTHSTNMCEQQKQWRLAYGTLLAGSVWLHYESCWTCKHAEETEV